MTELGIKLFGEQVERRSPRLSLGKLLIPALIAIIALNACVPIEATTQPEVSGGGATVAQMMEGGTASGFAVACENLPESTNYPAMLAMLNGTTIDICTSNMDWVVPVLSVVDPNVDLPYLVPTHTISTNYYTAELSGGLGMKSFDWENFDRVVAMKILLKSPIDPISPLQNEMGSCVPVGMTDDGFRQYVCEQLVLGDRGSLDSDFMPKSIVWETGQIAMSVKGSRLE